jgi:hypothetical protein
MMILTAMFATSHFLGIIASLYPYFKGNYFSYRGAGERASVPLGIILIFEKSSATFSPGR